MVVVAVTTVVVFAVSALNVSVSVFNVVATVDVGATVVVAVTTTVFAAVGSKLAPGLSCPQLMQKLPTVDSCS